MSRALPSTNAIKLFIHCTNCFGKQPAPMSPRQWAQFECGWTRRGFQVWCRRCELNVIHVDFEGQRFCAGESGTVRIVIPPAVADLIARQRDQLTGKSRSRAGKRVAADLKARGINPGFMKKRKDGK